MSGQVSEFTGRTFVDEGPFPRWMTTEQAVFNHDDTNAVYWVVRNRNGKFVRAFTHEYQAWRWTKDAAGWRYAPETMHAPDATGAVFNIFQNA